MKTLEDTEKRDAPWLVVPIALLLVLGPGLFLIAHWSIG